MERNICCFTGHRTIPEERISYVLSRLQEEIKELINGGVRYFICGGALGFDTLAAETVLNFKKSFGDISLILYLPCPSQSQKWKKSDVVKYNKILNTADSVIYTSPEYYNGCMLKRNRMMADASLFCVAYITKRGGGTFYTVEYARQKGLKMIYI